MRQQVAIAQDLVLVGGGHAHVHVLKSFGMRPMPGVRVTLIAREVETPYSGMLPGWVAGHYAFDECHIDLGRLTRFAGGRLIGDEAIGLDRAKRQLISRGHPPVRYDVLSLDIGSTPRAHDVPGAAENTVSVKPIAQFAARWEALLARARRMPKLRLAIVGGGAAGVELALCAQYRLAGLGVAPLEVVLVTRDGLLASHNRQVRRLFARMFAERGIVVRAGSAVVRVEPGLLICADGRRIAFDEALWVTDAGAASWLAKTGLPLTTDGFVTIDETLRSPADARIFAAGDVATMTDHPREKAGVYAVRQGPPLAANLRRALAGERLQRAVPQPRGLALIGTGDRHAVASRGPFAAYGTSWWQLKDWIDRRWMRRYRELPEMVPEPGEEPMRCGGCAAKVPAAVLGRVIDRLRPATSDRVAIGLDGADDAALIAFPGAPPLLQTVDFFRAMVDDPYLFGRIAATHALNDIYAMGGQPETALAIATLPAARPEIVEQDLFHMLRGGLDVLEPAGAVLVGGHSAEGAELALGFAVTGRAPSGTLLRKGGLRTGDRLILTKPLGTGIILAADGRGLAPARVVEGAIATMLQSAASAADCLVAHGATACTDVTGFGLLGHLLEMLRASNRDADLDPEAIPALDGALDLLGRGFTSSLHADNLAALAALATGEAHPVAALLIDPQTAGGLLAGIPAARAAACIARLGALGYRAAVIGRIAPASGIEPRVTPPAWRCRGRAGPGHRLMTGSEHQGRAALPAVDKVLRSERGCACVAQYGRALVVDAVRAALAERRSLDAAASVAEIVEQSARALARLVRPSQRRVFNLTGTVLHTNLGRAPLPEEAIAAAAEAMRDPSTLEYDLETGRRGERDDHVSGWLKRLTGAEAALAVNNNAGALVLVLNALADGRETIVSRGELIEIGGSFRLPDIMARAGTRLREVGTTNRTHLADFAAAIGPQTALILKAHTSNYTIEGFTAAVPAVRLAALAHERAIPFVEDLGSGSLIDLSTWGLPHEPTVAEALGAGADLVTFSGDKLLGGPQAGLIVGRADLIAALAKNPLKRALRLDKIRLAALEAVLRLYADPDRLPERLPTLRLLSRPAAEVEGLARRVLPALAKALAGVAEASLIETCSQIGSGALPVSLLPSTALALRPIGHRGGAVEALARALRALPVPVIGRIEAGTVLLDLRCLEDEAGFLAQLAALPGTTTSQE